MFFVAQSATRSVLETDRSQFSSGLLTITQTKERTTDKHRVLEEEYEQKLTELREEIDKASEEGDEQ